jgi:hypothetical protein
LERLEREAASVPPVHVLTEAEFDALSPVELMVYVRGSIQLSVIWEDDGPTLDEAFAAAGVAPPQIPPECTPYEAMRYITDADIAVKRRWMDEWMSRYMARRAARQAAKPSPGT